MIGPSLGQNLHEAYVRQTRQARTTYTDRLAAVRSLADAEALRDAAQAGIRAAFGPEPPRTPLNARVTRRIERDGYSIEMVVFESRPNYHVTANLYVPSGPGPFPCVLGACGHSFGGKVEAPYQQFCQHLARHGYLTLIYDPVSQGERHMYLEQPGDAWPLGPVQEHNMAGNPQVLVGDFLGMWRAWDGIRALDYLLSRPEADPARVGLTGNSGGGTLTCYLNALDPRFTMAAPSCFVTTYLANLENELPADAEQIPPGILAAGWDLSSFLLARAPRPVILLGQRNDFFDTRGLEAAYQDLRSFYAHFGAEDQVALYIGPRGHGYGIENRAAMVDFFNHQLALPAPSPEPEQPAIEPAAELQVLPEGEVLRLGSTPIWQFTAARAAELARTRPRLAGAELQAAVRHTLALPAQTDIATPHYRLLRPEPTELAAWPVDCPLAIEAEIGCSAVLHHFVASPEAVLFHLPELEHATLYLPDVSSLDDLRAGLLPANEGVVYALDVRGLGRARPGTCGDPTWFSEYGVDYFYASYANMFAEPLVGRRVLDVLLAIALLESRGCRRVDLVGRGLGAIHATFAALLSPTVGEVRLHDALDSYAAIAESGEHVHWWPLSCFPPRVLEHFDLPELRAALGSRCQLLSTWPLDRPRP